MKYTFVARVHDLEIDQVLNKGVVIHEGLRLANSKARMESMVDDFFKDLVGILEYNNLFKGPFLYSQGNVPDSLNYDFAKEEDRKHYLDYFLRLSQTFSTSGLTP